MLTREEASVHILSQDTFFLTVAWGWQKPFFSPQWRISGEVLGAPQYMRMVVYTFIYKSSNYKWNKKEYLDNLEGSIVSTFDLQWQHMNVALSAKVSSLVSSSYVSPSLAIFQGGKGWRWIHWWHSGGNTHYNHYECTRQREKGDEGGKRWRHGFLFVQSYF